MNREEIFWIPYRFTALGLQGHGGGVMFNGRTIDDLMDAVDRTLSAVRHEEPIHFQTVMAQRIVLPIMPAALLNSFSEAHMVEVA